MVELTLHKEVSLLPVGTKMELLKTKLLDIGVPGGQGTSATSQGELTNWNNNSYSTTGKAFTTIFLL